MFALWSSISSHRPRLRIRLGSLDIIFLRSQSTSSRHHWSSISSYRPRPRLRLRLRLGASSLDIVFFVISVDVLSPSLVFDCVPASPSLSSSSPRPLITRHRPVLRSHLTSSRHYWSSISPYCPRLRLRLRLGASSLDIVFFAISVDVLSPSFIVIHHRLRSSIW